MEGEPPWAIRRLLYETLKVGGSVPTNSSLRYSSLWGLVCMFPWNDYMITLDCVNNMKEIRK